MNAKGTRYTQSEIDKLANMYSSGLSIYRICKLLNRSETSVKNHLKKLGLFIPSELTEIEAYELNFKWLYWILIPLWIINAQTNPVDTILYLMFE
ncbi:helix-turn-helix domain-containing protein [Alphaproteobacteria bacterium]|nr:helix-turn-helix domain-containing protein [Alphaproteobacteria bacterium]